MREELPAPLLHMTQGAVACLQRTLGQLGEVLHLHGTRLPTRPHPRWS